MIYTYLPTEDAPATVIHALRTKPLPTNQAPLLQENCYFDEPDKSEGQQNPGNPVYSCNIKSILITLSLSDSEEMLH